MTRRGLPHTFGWLKIDWQEVRDRTGDLLPFGYDAWEAPDGQLRIVKRNTEVVQYVGGTGIDRGGEPGVLS